MIDLLKPRAKTLGQFVTDGRLFFVEDVDYDPAAVAKHLHAPGGRELLLAVQSTLDAVPVFDQGAIEEALRGLAAQRGIKPALPDSYDSRRRHRQDREPGSVRSPRVARTRAHPSPDRECSDPRHRVTGDDTPKFTHLY